MLLTYNELRELVDAGAIEGVGPDQINGASIDLTLGDEFQVEKQVGLTQESFVYLHQKETPSMHTCTGRMFLDPGQFCLAHTREGSANPANRCCSPDRARLDLSM